ncbi:GNAT family N-acetyltransferase [Halomarina pelagica]|uniref:GNAT family N-acetyltransferase n=1 Tax=Halomarina pelagica TaxID=2961599 RepID=UPI0020C2A69F|nr:hypothetical protein [Halomarina sp. BND7]
MRIIEATEADALYIEALLEANGYPTTGIREYRPVFCIGVDEGDYVGVGGYERYGRDALFRPIVVEEAVRGKGYRRGICTELFRRVERAGATAVYLRTRDPEYFSRIGFDDCDPATVPRAIRETSTFSDDSMASVRCMRRTLPADPRPAE